MPLQFRHVFEQPEHYLEDLLDYIAEGSVIPIIGPELGLIQHDGRELLLYQYIAEQLAEREQLTAQLSADLNDAAAVPSLEQVVALYTRNKPVERVYPLIKRIVEGQSFAPPEPLLKLARIPKFRLFVTTTFDPLLTQALNQVRFHGGDRTRVISYAPNLAGKEDLEPGWQLGRDPIVVHLLGRLSPSPTYVVTEEDTLEFLYALQENEARRPQLLFDELKNNHLLLLGCSFPDWLSRFFIRLAKRDRLSAKRSMEIVADSKTRADGSLALFLDCYSTQTRVFAGTAVEFVDRLVDAWEQRYGRAESFAPTEPPASASMRMPPGAVFISYASEDREAAERLCNGLSDVTDVWLDRQVLKAGEDYDRRIRWSISRCSLFVPLISRNATSRWEGYFHREWNLAVDRLRGMAAGIEFVVPVVIDDTPVNAEGVNDEFWRYHVARLPGGQVTDDFREEIRRKVRQIRRVEAVS